jgi:hypothetical protein
MRIYSIEISQNSIIKFYYFSGGIRVADDDVDNYGQMWMNVDKTIGYVLASEILRCVVFIKLKQIPTD